MACATTLLPLGMRWLFFVKKGLREESRLPCTSRLQKWNRPRQRNVAPPPPPRRVADIQVVKEEEYGKKKRHRKSPHEDPRPTNMRMPVPQEQDDLREALRAEHVQLRSFYFDELLPAPTAEVLSKDGSGEMRSAVNSHVKMANVSHRHPDLFLRELSASSTNEFISAWVAPDF